MSLEPQRKRILVVEDDDFNLLFMKELLATLPVECIEARTAEEAMARARDSAPDLVLMDIQLRHGSGLEVTRQLKADGALQHIPIVAVTALAMDADRERVLEAGCDAYVAKPIDVTAFIEAITAYLGGEG